MCLYVLCMGVFLYVSQRCFVRVCIPVLNSKVAIFTLIFKFSPSIFTVESDPFYQNEIGKLWEL